jgi:serine/threonine protein phosphatase 1
MFARFLRSSPATATARALPTLPEGTRLYAVGDIHGQHLCLQQMLELLRDDYLTHPVQHVHLVFLGDYVDRGNASAAVVQTLIDITQEDTHITCLLGNHEWALLRFLDGTLSYDEWYRWGGDTTLESYGVMPEHPTGEAELSEAMRCAFAEAFPPEHEAFLRALPLTYAQDGYLFVHAGLRPNVPLEEQTLQDMVLIRRDFLNHPVTDAHTIIHGHTIFETPHIRDGSIGIDTGAYATGVLTAVALEGDGYRFIST